METTERLRNHREKVGRLTEDDVRLIRALREQSDLTAAEIAQKFEVSRTTVTDLLSGRTWRNV